MKLLFVLIVLFVFSASIAAAEDEEDVSKYLNEQEKKHLESTPLEKLPERFQQLVRSSRAAGDTSHWCCKINPVKTITNTRAVSFMVRTTHSVKGYKHCHAFGWGRCTTYSTGYGQSVAYKVQYHSRQVPIACPDVHLICCKGYIKVGQKDCIPISKLAELTPDLAALYTNGVVIG